LNSGQVKVSFVADREAFNKEPEENREIGRKSLEVKKNREVEDYLDLFDLMHTDSFVFPDIF
jgi:pentatricopeptide repeat protein